MRPYDIIRKKRDGGELSEEEIRFFIEGVTRDTIPDYQTSALLMAIYFRGLSSGELALLTDAMKTSGRVLELPRVSGFKVDKHSTGGVGDKISLPLAPLVAAAGVAVPMVSGRGLGHTGGTLDKLEAIPGFTTDLPLDRFEEIIVEAGFSMIGQTKELAPADRKLYALRDVTATVESIPLIAASIMSKKLAEGIDGLVLDVKVGSGAFMKRKEDARTLAETMVGIGRSMGKRTVAFLTCMDQPLGVAVGNALETEEAIEVLRGGGPPDVRELTLTLGARMLTLAGAADSEPAARRKLEACLADASALERFRKMVTLQGGDPAVVEDPRNVLPQARHEREYPARKEGFVQAIDTEAIGIAAALLGAGRMTMEDRIDPAVGLLVHKKIGEHVRAGEPLVTLRYNDERRLAAAIERLEQAYVFSPEPPPSIPLVFEVIEG